jgi:ketosteroid isomerase-like protein
VTTHTDPATVAERFFAAIEAGDAEAARDLYAPDAQIWHNTDGITMRPEDNLKTLAWMARNLPDLQYTQVRRSATVDGFVQQHVLVATNRAGRRIEVPACIVIVIEDGRITRLDEYLDSASVAAIMAK